MDYLLFAGQRLTVDDFDRIVLRALKTASNRESGHVSRVVSHYSVARWLYARPQSRSFERVRDALKRLVRQRLVRQVVGSKDDVDPNGYCRPQVYFAATAKGRRAR